MSIVAIDFAAGNHLAALAAMRDECGENDRKLEAVIARQAKARALGFDRGGSFGFRGRRYEAIPPQAGGIMLIRWPSRNKTSTIEALQRRQP